MTHDPKCHQLAEAFLEEQPKLNRADVINRMANAIQQCIEDFIADELGE